MVQTAPSCRSASGLSMQSGVFVPVRLLLRTRKSNDLRGMLQSK